MPDPAGLSWLASELAALERAGLRRRERVATGLHGDVVDYGSNDYLGLAVDERVRAAAAAAASDGWGAGASPVVSGRSEKHAELEARIAEFEGVEAALVFSSGYAVNSGVIPALADDGDVIYADAKNHASLIDGCRLSRARRRVYPHGDAGRLAEWLDSDTGQYRRRLIVTDTLFSMDGDFAPLAELGRLAERHGAMLLVDEAHATGVWGANGRGAVERAAAETPSLPAQVAVRVGTLSKAFGSSGGFVAGSRALIEWLRNRARPYVYSTASPPAVAAAALAAIAVVLAEPERRRRVIESSAKLRERLRNAGWSLARSESQIVPLLVREPTRAMELSRGLAERGMFVPAIRPPTVPRGESLLRVSVTANHSDGDLDRLVAALAACGRPP